MEQNSKKDWIKNALIVFLIIMLLLTLFSNTITNYTLPQVSISQVTQNEVATAIRGTGNIVVGDTYTIKATEKRTILATHFEKGDHVEAGDVIFDLKDMDDSKLSDARKNLIELETNYYKSLLTNADLDPDVAVKINNMGASSFESYIRRIKEVDDKIDAIKEQINEKTVTLENYSVNNKVIAISKATDTYEKNLADEAKTEAEKAFNTAKTNAQNDIQRQIDMLTSDKNSITAHSGSGELSRLRTDLNTIFDGIWASLSDSEKEYRTSSTPSASASPATNADAVKEPMIGGVTKSDINSEPELVLKRYYGVLANHYVVQNSPQDYLLLCEDAEQAMYSFEESLANDDDINYINEILEELKYQKEDIQNMVFTDTDSYKAVISRYNQLVDKVNRYAITDAKNDAQVEYINKEKDRLNREYENLNTEKSNLLKEIGYSLDAEKNSAEIVLKKEEIAKLEERSMGATIVTPVSGTIHSISKKSGEEFNQDEELCVIIPDGKDLSIKIPVTNEQAKKVKIGDTGVLANPWAYPDAVCVVKSITDDADNPGKGSIVTFVITGSNLVVGQSMTVSIEADARTYDAVVPKSAIKQGNGGEYVYVIEEKSSPLGNRYIAQKVSVRVVAQDDNYAAIEGDIVAYDKSVITSSNKMVEAGKQVRLSESNSN